MVSYFRVEVAMKTKSRPFRDGMRDALNADPNDPGMVDAQERSQKKFNTRVQKIREVLLNTPGVRQKSTG